MVLHIACEKGYVEIVKFILDRAKSLNNINFEHYINSKTILGLSPLHYATENNHIPIIEMLLTEGSTVNSLSFGGITPLHHSSSYCNQLDIAKKIVEAGAKIDSEEMKKGTPLLFTAANNCKETVEFLLKKHAKVNYQDDSGASILYTATKQGYSYVVRLLLQFGADPNSEGTYPIQLAAKHSDVLSTKYLLMHKAKLYSINDKSYILPPVIIAAQYGSYDTFEQLSKQDEGIVAEDTDGMNVMHAAAAGGHIHILNYIQTLDSTLLLSHDKNFGTAMHHAAANNQVAAVKYLKNSGLSIDLRDKNGLTALHIAGFNKNLEAVKTLIEEGANYNVINIL